MKFYSDSFWIEEEPGKFWEFVDGAVIFSLMITRIRIKII